jgi:hypothetical protein
VTNSTVSAPLIPDFSNANADLDALVLLSSLFDFDLFEFIRLLSNAGAPVMTCNINDAPAGSAGGRVVVYQLSEALQSVLAALRARNGNASEI